MPRLGDAFLISAMMAGAASAAAKSRRAATESVAARSSRGVRRGRDRRLDSTISARMSGTAFTIAGIFMVAGGRTLSVMEKTALVTGGGRGIGRAIALA